MSKCIRSLLAAAVAISAAPVSQGALFTEDFDTDSTSEWTWASTIGGDGTNDNTGNEYNPFFDYSTIGIPSAPNSVGGTTLGMKLEANVAGNIFAGSSASPNGQSFTGDYILRMDVWQNYNGPLGPTTVGGNGSTQVTWSGIGVNGTTAQFPGTSVQGAGFGATGDGGSGDDYRAYTNIGAPVAVGTNQFGSNYQANSRNNTAAYYTSNFPGGKTAPAAQTALFPQQSGTTPNGVQGFAWHQHEIVKEGDKVTWSIDGVLISTIDVTTDQPFGGSNIFLGYFDINSTSSTDPNDEALLFGLFDNVVVDVIPEPAGLALVALGGLALARRRRRA